MTTHPKNRHWQWARLGLLLVFFAQLLSAATRTSATIDEGFHITSGYEYLRTGKLRLFDEHAPLAKALFAWPLFFVPDLTPLEQAPGYRDGDLITAAQATVLAYRPIDRVIVACRIPAALLTLMLAATVCRWATARAGKTGGVFVLALFTFDPNILAHGSLATTDMGATAFIFWTLMALSSYQRHPTRRRWWVTAVHLGLAQSAKLTALTLFPIGGLLILASVWQEQPHLKLRGLLRATYIYGGMVVVASIVLWATYGFELRPLPELANGTLPLPAASHIERWLRLRANLSYGREAFLLGQNGMHGWWQYFPLAFLVKTPLPFLLLIIVSTTSAVVKLVRHPAHFKHRIPHWLPITIFPLVYSVASLTSTINIGYRHLLPILPFMYVAVGNSWATTNRFIKHIPQHLFRAIGIALCVWQAIATLAIAPHYIPYFNALAGGPDKGWRFLADSNTDWGQTLKALAAYQQQHNTGPVKLSLFTFLDPEVYHVTYVPIAPMQQAPPVLPQRFNPEPGLYAISATTLDGVPLPYPATYNGFQHREPVAQIAHAMHLYDVPDTPTRRWVAQCSLPVAPLTRDTITEGFGISNIRTITFDCEQGWIIPLGDGWYVRATPGIDKLRWPRADEHLERWPAWTEQLALDPLHLSYEQSQAGELPPFTIWEWAASAITPAQTIPETTLDETITFLGYDAPARVRVGETINVITYWRVHNAPTRPLSLMLHLISAEGTSVAVGDGLGVPIDQWRSGDIIINRHQLGIPTTTELGEYKLLSGAYWLDTMQRLKSDKGETLELTSIRLTP